MKNYTQLREEERVKIFELRQLNHGIRSIARHLSRDKGTISRELKRNRYSDSIEYLPDIAQQKTDKRKHVLELKIDNNERLKNYIIEKLKIKWSPDIIAAKSYEDIQVKISIETIYSYVYHEDNQYLKLYVFLMSGRKKRNPLKGRKVRTSTIPNRVSIHDRPVDIDGTTEIGHFEGDLTFFKGNQSKNLGVLIDKASRFVMLMKNESKKSTEVMKNMFNTLAQLPESMRKSMTLDNGKEFTFHELIVDFLNMKTYFCDKSSPWQKGSVEKQNAFLHWWLPKKMNINKLSEKQLQEVQNQINNRPRKILGYKTPAEIFYGYMSFLESRVKLAVPAMEAKL